MSFVIAHALSWNFLITLLVGAVLSAAALSALTIGLLQTLAMPSVQEQLQAPSWALFSF